LILLTFIRSTGFNCYLTSILKSGLIAILILKAFPLLWFLSIDISMKGKSSLSLSELYRRNGRIYSILNISSSLWASPIPAPRFRASSALRFLLLLGKFYFFW